MFYAYILQSIPHPDQLYRGQYETLALNMRAALPRALYLAFTGTPLIATQQRTKEVFGDYVSIYDFQQSGEDGATVPLSMRTARRNCNW